MKFKYIHMQSNLFLTGPVQIGKSTAINRALEILNPANIGGFRTIGTNYTADGKSDVVIYSANKSPNTGHIVAHRENGTREAFPPIFDTYGSEYLKNDADFILMDELGFLETEAHLFQDAVIEAIEKSTPVLGVIRHGKNTPFLDNLRKREDITILMVTEENRNEIPKKIVEFFREGE